MAKNFLKVKNGVTFKGLSSAPSDPQNGDTYYDTTLNKLRTYQNGAWEDVISSSSGDVTGPASSVNNNVVFFDGTTGKLIKDSGLSLSGTNTGDVTLGTVGSSPNSNGASLSSQVLTLQPANASNPGLVSTGAQTFAGNKTFNNNLILGNGLVLSTVNFTGTGVATIDSSNAVEVRLTNASLTSIRGILAPTTRNFRIITNITGAQGISILNEDSSETANNRIITGYDRNINLANGQSIIVYYDTTASRWRIASSNEIKCNVNTTSSDITLDLSNDFVLVSASSGTRTITLPDAINFSGKKFTIKKSDSSLNSVIITSSVTIDGVTSIALSNQYDSITVIAHSGFWFII
jgi:hypothetical protein